MFYDVSILTPANTPAATPVETDLPVAHGVIHRVEVEFPSGCAGLVHVQIFRFEQKIYPSNPLGSFCSDDYVIAFNDYFELLETPYTLLIRTWNLDDTYPHTPRVRVGILPKTIAEHVYGRLTKVDRDRLYKSFGIPPPRR